MRCQPALENFCTLNDEIEDFPQNLEQSAIPLVESYNITG